jgi:DNA-binding LacI/PurR family transcriptional regulator
MNDPEPASQVTMKEVARKVGLAQSTVSKALRNAAEIPAATRERVRAAAREMGYQPNPMGTGLAEFKRTSKTTPVRAALAWINCWPEPKKLRSYKEFDQYWQGAAAAAQKLGYRLEEFECNERLPPGRLEKILVARGIHGLLLPPNPRQPDWSDFHWERFSIARIGRTLATPIAPIVTADQVANAITAVDEIRARGYKRIGFVSDNNFTDRGWLFDAGFLRAQREMNKRDRLPIFDLEYQDVYASQPALLRWLKKEKPDAVVTARPEVPDMLKRCGYRIPEDIGFVAMSTLDGKGDAGIYQNSEEIGRVAVLLLISLMTDNARGELPVFRQILIKGRWVDGMSLPRRA